MLKATKNTGLQVDSFLESMACPLCQYVFSFAKFHLNSFGWFLTQKTVDGKKSGEKTTCIPGVNKDGKVTTNLNWCHRWISEPSTGFGGKVPPLLALPGFRSGKNVCNVDLKTSDGAWFEWQGLHLQQTGVFTFLRCLVGSDGNDR